MPAAHLDSANDVDLETPLLNHESDGAQPATATTTVDGIHSSGNCSFRGGVSNLIVTAVGAGMLALPKAFSTVGIALGVSIAILAGALTIFSASIIVKNAAGDGAPSYIALVSKEFGSTGAAILSASIIIHVFGVMIVYLMIISDQLVGSSPDYLGLLPTILNRHDGPWWLSRSTISGVLVLTIVTPLLVSRSLTFLSRFSQFSVRLLLTIAATLLTLAVTAVVQGTAAKDVYVLPNMSEMYDGSIAAFITSLLAVLAVSALAFTLHFNLVPIHRSLRDKSTPVMLHATRCAVAIAGILYIAVALSGYVLFGSETDGDILKNLTIQHMVTVLPPSIATSVMTFLVLATSANLLINFVLKVWAVREAGCELLLGLAPRDLPASSYYSITAALVVTAWGISIVMPSVWFLVSLVGSTACVTFAYAFPGMLLVRRAESVAGKAAGVGAVVLAVVMAGTAIYNAITGGLD